MDTRPFASILFTAFDRNRSTTRYSRCRRRTPSHVFLRAAAAHRLATNRFIHQGENRQTRSRRDCPIGARFTLTRNEGLMM